MNAAQIEAMIAEQVAIQVAAARAPPPAPIPPKPDFFSGTASFYVSHVRLPVGDPKSWGLGVKADVCRAYGIENKAMPFSGEYAFSKVQAFKKARELAEKFDLPVKIYGWRDLVPETSDSEEIRIVQVAMARDWEHRNERIKDWPFAGKPMSFFVATTDDLITEFKGANQ
jgi:hypothetical protein